jgi:hypothetical protein
VATISRAAAHVYCSRSQFDEYLAKGVVTRQPSGQYDLDEVRREVLTYLRKVASGRGTGANADRLTDERALWTAAKRRREEMAEQVALGNLVSTRAVVLVLGGYVAQCRERLLSLAGKWAGLLVGCSFEEIDEALTGEVHEALDGLAAERITADIIAHDRESKRRRQEYRTSGRHDGDGVAADA